MIRVLIADDEQLIRAGLRLIVESQPDMEVIGEAGDGVEAIERTRRLRPDVVVMDIRMPTLDGLEATRRIVATSGPLPRVIVLTTFDLDEYVYDALRAGASGFLLKHAPEEQLLAAIRVDMSGTALFSPSVTRRLVEEFVRNRPPAEVPPELGVLSARERDVLVLIAKGLSNRQIADELVISEHTVKTHVTHILDKLDLRDRTHAVVLAYEAGLVRPGRA